MRVETRQEHHYSLVRLLDEITADPGSARLESLAGAVGFSGDHLNRIFRGFTGESLHQFRRRLLLERSARELLTSDMAVWEAAGRAGYSTPEAFSKAFRKAFGQPPEAFRKVGDWRIPCRSDIHWGGEGRYPAVVAGAEAFGIGLETVMPVRFWARRFVGDFVRVPGEWERMRAELPEGLVERATWATVFVSDGLKAKDRGSMVSFFCFKQENGVRPPPGFERLRVRGGPFATSDWLVGRRSHALAWTFLNERWVPPPEGRTEQPGYDLYRRYPSPWEAVEAKILLSLV